MARPRSWKDRPWLKDHSSAPTRENAANWMSTKIPEPIIAFCESRSERVASTRCTISWSEPWLAIAKIAPPMIAVGSANGLVRMCAIEKFGSNTWNLPAAAAAANPSAPTDADNTMIASTAPPR